MRERAQLRDLERLNAAQGALCRQAEAKLADALDAESKRRATHDAANTAFEDSLEDCRRAMSSANLDPTLREMFARAPTSLAQTLSSAASALSAAEALANRERFHHARACVIARNGRDLERQSRRRLARKIEERVLSAHEDLFALKSVTP